MLKKERNKTSELDVMTKKVKKRRKREKVKETNMIFTKFRLTDVIDFLVWYKARIILHRVRMKISVVIMISKMHQIITGPKS